MRRAPVAPPDAAPAGSALPAAEHRQVGHPAGVAGQDGMRTQFSDRSIVGSDEYGHGGAGQPGDQLVRVRLVNRIRPLGSRS